eukprot:11193409-Lingulodinium_polyedra.AAC.1
MYVPVLPPSEASFARVGLLRWGGMHIRSRVARAALRAVLVVEPPRPLVTWVTQRFRKSFHRP